MSLIKAEESKYVDNDAKIAKCEVSDSLSGFSGIDEEQPTGSFISISSESAS